MKTCSAKDRFHSIFLIRTMLTGETQSTETGIAILGRDILYMESTWRVQGEYSESTTPAQRFLTTTCLTSLTCTTG